MSSTPAGWYPDPNTPGTLRYWDGTNWTQQTQTQPSATPSFGNPTLSSSSPFSDISGGGFQQTFSGTTSVYGNTSTGRFITFGEAIKRGFVRYSVWRGRAPRSEYWFFTLFQFLVLISAAVIDGLIFGVYSTFNGGVFYWISAIALFLPSLAVYVRRLHDSNKSAHFLWLFLVPIGGWIALFVFALLPSQPGSNRFGNPGE